MSRIALATLLVRDYDEAIAFYTERLGFDLIEDSALDGGKRWVMVAPPGAGEAALLLGQASTARQRALVGGQTGERVASSCTPRTSPATTRG